MSKLLTTRLPDDLSTALDELVGESSSNKSEIVVVAITEYVESRRATRDALLDRIFADRAELFERLK